MIKILTAWWLFMASYSLSTHTHTHRCRIPYAMRIRVWPVRGAQFAFGRGDENVCVRCTFLFTPLSYWIFLSRLPFFWRFKQFRVKLCDSHGIDFVVAPKKEGWLCFFFRLGFAYNKNIVPKIGGTDTNEMRNCGDDKCRTCALQCVVYRHFRWRSSHLAFLPTKFCVSHCHARRE